MLNLPVWHALRYSRPPASSLVWRMKSRPDTWGSWERWLITDWRAFQMLKLYKVTAALVAASDSEHKIKFELLTRNAPQ